MRSVAMSAVALTTAIALVVAWTGKGGARHAAGASVRGRSAERSASAAASARADAAKSPSREAGREAIESPRVSSLVALGRPIYCAGAKGNEVALTFDDGPGTYTKLAIAKLRKHRVKATFFAVGRNIELLPQAIREERELGSVGDHTYTHPLLTALPAAQAESEIVRTQTALERASGRPVFLFRPPYGGRDATIDAIARRHGLLEIMWTVDSRDSLGADYAQIERNVIDSLRPGAIVLMHENHGQTIRALPSIFAALRRKRLRAVSVPRLLSDDPPSPARVRAGSRGCGVGASAGRGGG
ncbi:MAG TPA: polysaccharide deacetylase family protein [Solirubrobacteraceae bacterium]|nr:polysaccharide deacetylase family protein [Solirubrobacteraceae bacterium]